MEDLSSFSIQKTDIMFFLNNIHYIIFTVHIINKCLASFRSPLLVITSSIVFISMSQEDIMSKYWAFSLDMQRNKKSEGEIIKLKLKKYHRSKGQSRPQDVIRSKKRTEEYKYTIDIQFLQNNRFQILSKEFRVGRGKSLFLDNRATKQVRLWSKCNAFIFLRANRIQHLYF